MLDENMEFDIDAIMEGTESTLDIIFDEEQAFDAECEATTISDDIDDSTLDSMIGYDDLVTDQDIDDIDSGKTPSGGDPIDDDADAAADDPEIFHLQKDIFQNSLLTENDIKNLDEGMSLEEFTANFLHENEGLGQGSEIDKIDGSVCPECGQSPCVCSAETDHFDLDNDYHTYDMKEIVKLDDDDDDELDFDDHDHDDDDEDDDDHDDDHDDDDEDDDDHDDDDDHFDLHFDDEEDAPSFAPAGPVQPLHGGKECGESGTACAEEDDLFEHEGGNLKMEDKEMIKNAYAEGYEDAIKDLEAELEAAEAEESLQEAMDDLEEDIDMLDEDVELEEEVEVEEETEETEEEIASLEESGLEEEISDLDSIDEALEDIEIFNKFEGSSINDDDYDANEDLFTGWKDNTDEKGLGRYEDQNTLPFDHVTSASFDNMDKDDSIESMLK